MSAFWWRLRAFIFFIHYTRHDPMSMRWQWAWEYVESIRTTFAAEGVSPKDAVLEDMSYWGEHA